MPDGLDAVRNGLTVTDAERLRESPNLQRFLVLVEAFREEWLRRLPDQPRVEDVERAFLETIAARWNPLPPDRQ